MKKTVILIFVLVTLCIAQTSLNVMTFNIRYNTPNDGENAWPNRLDMVKNTIIFHKVDVLGVQEALYGQVQQLDSMLVHFNWVGVGRDDGNKAGEYSALFFDSTKYDLVKNDNFWLCQTPDKPGLGWDAVCIRLVTWAILKDKSTLQEIAVFNTHYDHRGEKARTNSSKLILEKIPQIAQDRPIILMGDFNATPDSAPYEILANSELLINCKTISQTPHYGAQHTFSGFDVTRGWGNAPIDHIFVNKDFSVCRHATISTQFDGRVASDHYAIFTELELNKDEK